MSSLSTTPDVQTPQQAAAAIDQFRADFAAVREQIARVIVGHSEVVDDVLIALFCGGHVLIEGVPGLGKTLLVRCLSRALSLSFSRIQFTPDLMPADISGTTIVVEVDRLDASGSVTGKGREFTFQPGPVFAQIVLADEINRATPKTQAAMLEAMAEQNVTVGGRTHPLPRPFLVLATQNPLEQEGTYPLPEAQLDRFFFKLLVGYSSRDELNQILNRTTTGQSAEIRPILSGESILNYQALVHRAVMAPHVQDYAVRLTLGTHPRRSGSEGEHAAHGDFATPMVNRFVKFGVSPRAAQALVLAAKCRAMIDGRAAASVEDIRRVAPGALRHRLILNFEAQAEGVTADAVVENLISTLPVATG